MKVIKLLILTLISFSAYSQTVIKQPMEYSKVLIDSLQLKPSDTTGAKKFGAVVLKGSDSTVYYFDGTKWTQFGSGGGTGSDQDLSPYAFKAIPLNNQTTNYTLNLNDASQMVSINNANTSNVIVPLNSSVAFPIGTQILISRDGTGDVNIAPVVGVTIRSADSLKLASQYSKAFLVKRGTDVWDLGGNLKSASVAVGQSDGKIHLSTFGTTGTNSTLTTALSFGKTVVIDQGLNITSDYTVPQGSILEVVKGVQINTSGTAKLTIAGQLIAGAYQIFSLAANVKLKPYSVTEIYPEWFGAQALNNPRNSTIAAGATDATAAFKKCITLIESSIYVTKVFGAIIRLRGWYGITDQLEVHGGYRFVGTTPEFEGSGLRWLGTPDATKSMILFMEAEYAGCEDMGFRGRGSSTSNGGLKAAIELTWNSTIHTERGMYFKNLVFGNPIGYFYDDNAGGYDFERAIYCSGTSGNNDFHTIEDINVADTKIGIEVETDQAVEWRISNYRMNFGRTMYKSGLGGSVTADRWYAEATGAGGYPVIEVGGSLSEELRISIINFSSEYIRGSSLISTNAKLKLSVTGENYIAINQNHIDANDGFALVKGFGNAYDGEFLFQNTRFEFGTDGTARTVGYVNNTPRLYFEQNQTNSKGIRSLTFENCSGAKAIYFKFPSPYDSRNSSYTNLTFRGEKNVSGTIDGNYYQQDKKLIVNARNPAITQGVGARWLSVINLFTGETEIPNHTVYIGEKGKTPMAGISVKGLRSTTVSGFINSIPAILPAKSIIKGVSVLTQESNVMTSPFNYVTVGTVKNERMYGTISMPDGFQYNSITANPYPTDTAENLIIKGYTRFPDNVTYTISGTTLTSSSSPFTSSMVGGIFRYLSGANKNKEFIVTGFNSASSLTVSNPQSISDATGGIGEIQTPIIGGKGLSITVNYEELSKYVEQVDVDFAASLPVVSAVSKTPVLYERQLVFNGIDTSGFGGGSGGGGAGIDETNLVHKTGAESIAGTKTFSSQLQALSGIRASNNTSYVFRNAANTADITGIGTTTDDVVHIASGAPIAAFDAPQSLFNTATSWANGINVGNASVISTNNTLGYCQVNSTNDSYYSLIRLDNTNTVQLGSGGFGIVNTNVAGNLTGNAASFSGNVTVPAGTSSGHAVNKGQLDAAIAGIKKVVSDANYTATSSDNTLILLEPSTARTFTLPAASTMANKELWVVCRSSTTGRWILSGSFVQRGTTGTSLTENFINSGLATGVTYHLVSDGSKWYDIND